MKNYLILAMILLAGMTAYPQATKTARETRKTEKGSTRKEAAAQRNATKSGAKSTRSNSVERSKSTQSRPAQTRTRVETRSNDRMPATRSANQQSRTRVDTRSNDRMPATRSTNDAARRSQEQSRVRTNTEQQTKSGNAERRQQTSSATRVYREGKGTLTRDDGSVVRHQNDEVFKSRNYKLDYDNYENLRRSDEFRRDFRDYDDWYRRRNIRVINHYNNRYIPLSFEFRRSRYYYRQPLHIDLIWTPLLFHRFMFYYPTQNNWDMEFGSQIETIPADQAQEYAGNVRRIYGKVSEVYFSPGDENYILYIGAPFPNQDISVVVPKQIALNLTMSPKWYFEDEYVWVVGLIDLWEGKPEMIVRDEDQIRKY